jgi:hypothetical protein
LLGSAEKNPGVQALQLALFVATLYLPTLQLEHVSFPNSIARNFPGLQPLNFVGLGVGCCDVGGVVGATVGVRVVGANVGGGVGFV